MIIRHIAAHIQKSLKHFPVVLIIGARQVGKSTLAKQLIEQGLLKQYTTLDDLSQLKAAKHDLSSHHDQLDLDFATGA